MKRIVMVCGGLAVVALAAALAEKGRAQGPAYPGVPGYEAGQGRTNQPWLPTSPPPRDRRLDPKEANRLILAEWKEPQDNPDMNRDLLVTPEVGSWMIFIYSYEEARAPSLARSLALELRQNYQLPAFIWNYGDDERKQELERVRQEVERRKEALRQAGLSTTMPIHVPRMKIRVQCAVLVGGYKDIDAARREAERIKKLKPLDAARFKLPDMFIIPPENAPQRDLAQRASVNPFLKAFPVRNPTVTGGQPVQKDTQDLAVLQRLNADESLSLLQSRKPWTLAVKQFQVPTVVETSGSPAGFWQKLGLGGGSGAKKDAAKESAHNLAELLRKGGWEAYVLHTRYNSIVTVGSYDGMEDPRIPPHQEALARLNPRLAQIQGVDLQLFPRAIPMPVPRDIPMPGQR